MYKTYCDCCGKEIEYKDKLKVVFNVHFSDDTNGVGYGFDLCKECSKDLKEPNGRPLIRKVLDFFKRVRP